MSASCDFVDVGAQEFLDGAKDLETFAAAMKRKFGRDIDPALLQSAFGKAADRYARNMEPLGAIKLDLAKELAKGRRSGLLETVTALRRAGLLTGPKTIVRNVAGNTASIGFDAISRFPAALVDMAIGKFTGNRTISPMNLGATRAGWGGFLRDGLKEARDVMKKGMTDSDLAKYDIPRELNAYAGGRELTWLNNYVNFVNRAQGAQDKFFRGFMFKRSLGEQADILAKSEGLKGPERAARINALMTSPPEAIRLQAVADAEQAVFANQNKLADALSAGANRMGEGGKFVLDTLVPFRKVPTNVTGRVLESSPLGLVHSSINLGKIIKAGGLDEAAQKQFATAFGRGATGSALLYLGYRLAENGKMTGGYSNDPGTAGREEAVGHSPGSLLINGQSYQLDGSPAGILLAVGASMHRDTTEGKKPSSVAMSGVSQAGKQILDSPFLQGVSDLESSARRPEQEGARFLKGLAGSVVPSIVNTFGEMSDTTQRAARTPGEAIQGRIPGLRTNLPARRDALGETIQTANWWNPTIGKQERNNPVTREIDRLKIPIQKPNRITDPKKELYDKDERAYQERVKFVGNLVRKSLERLVNSEFYKNYPDARKKEMLSEAISDAKADATERLKDKASRAKLTK